MLPGRLLCSPALRIAAVGFCVVCLAASCTRKRPERRKRASASRRRVAGRSGATSSPGPTFRLPDVAYFAAPDGKPDNPGTKDSPWDIASALDGTHKIEPGATVFLRSGVYRRRAKGQRWDDWTEKFEIKLAGTEDKPIHVRPFPGEHVIIDGGVAAQAPSTHVWVWDLEIMVSEPNAAEPVEPGSHPESFTRPWGGLDIMGGEHLKFIDLAIHHCRQGVSFWTNSHNTDIYGALIYDNGWPGKDRGHGHAIYTQNQFETGFKRILDCIMTGGYSYTMHAYGSRRAYVDNYVIEGCIAYAAGAFLVGGGRPSRGIRVLDNALYGVPMQIGYNAPHNEDCEVRGNVIANAGMHIKKYKKVVNQDNLVLAKADARPAEPRIVFRPNKYDRNRAHLAIFNWQKSPQVEVAVGEFMKEGERYRLHHPKRLFGKPVHEGACQSGRIVVPMDGEFAAYVVLARFGKLDEARWQDAQRLQEKANVSGRASKLYDQGKAAEALEMLRQAGFQETRMCRTMAAVAQAVPQAEAALSKGDLEAARAKAQFVLGREKGAENAYRRRARPCSTA